MSEHHEIALKETIANEITFFRGTLSFSGLWITTRPLDQYEQIMSKAQLVNSKVKK
jgi:hypothetical protein